MKPEYYYDRAYGNTEKFSRSFRVADGCTWLVSGEKEMNPIQVVMVEEFQCPGCVSGHNTSSGCFKESNASLECENHIAGTTMFPGGKINLGLTRGFNRIGPIDNLKQRSNIRLYESMPSNHYNKFNIPVWAMELEGYLFVRCFIPRLNLTWVDVIKDGKIKDIPEFNLPVDVGTFIEEID